MVLNFISLVVQYILRGAYMMQALKIKLIFILKLG